MFEDACVVGRYRLLKHVSFGRTPSAPGRPSSVFEGRPPLRLFTPEAFFLFGRHCLRMPLASETCFVWQDALGSKTFFIFDSHFLRMPLAPEHVSVVRMPLAPRRFFGVFLTVIV